MSDDKMHESESELDYEPSSSPTDEVENEGSRVLLREEMRRLFREEMPALLREIKGGTNTATNTATGTGGAKSSASGGSSCAGECSATARRYEHRLGVGILEPFDPSVTDANVQRWLNKIDQLGEIHGWTGYERSCYMQEKLSGPAREWYHRLNNFDLTWGEWKETLTQAFPCHHDHRRLLEEMLQRRKQTDETMTEYYHAVIALCYLCKQRGEDAVSIVIGGLPEELRPGAYAIDCKTPDELYRRYLAGLNNYGIGVAHGGAKRRIEFQIDSPVRTTVKSRVAFPGEKRGFHRCFNCQEMTTHYSRDCPKPKLNRCIVCKQSGHHGSECPKDRRQPVAGPSRPSHKVSTVTEACMLQGYKRYGKLASGELAKVLIDTGSEQNLATCAVVLKEGATVEHTDVMLRGFGGGQTKALGRAKLQVTIDGVRLDIEALVTDQDLAKADVILGQPTFSATDVLLSVTGGKAVLSRRKEDSNPFRSMNVESRTDRCVVRLKNDLVLHGGEVPVPAEVEIVGGTPEQYVVMPTKFIH